MGFYTRIQEKGKDPIDIGNNGDFFIAEDMPVGENFSKEEYTDLLTRRTPKYLLIDIVKKDFVFKISPHTHLERN